MIAVRDEDTVVVAAFVGVVVAGPEGENGSLWKKQAVRLRRMKELDLQVLRWTCAALNSMEE